MASAEEDAVAMNFLAILKKKKGNGGKMEKGGGFEKSACSGGVEASKLVLLFRKFRRSARGKPERKKRHRGKGSGLDRWKS